MSFRLFALVGLSVSLLAGAYACDDASSTPVLPDASFPPPVDASFPPPVDATVPPVDAAPDAAPDGPVIVGCVPQEISTRYDAVWLFGRGCRADWNAQNDVTFSGNAVTFEGFEGTICAANPFTGALFAASDGVNLYGADGGRTNDASLGANVSAAQPVAFMGKPGSAADFYVITNSASSGEGTSAGLLASTLACGSATPNGAPVAIPGTTDFTEALMTVRHANNVDRWLLSVAPTGIAVIPVTAAGFGAPVITAFGGTLTGVVAAQRAFIAFARDRRTFAITAEDRGLVTGSFDNATGAITDLKTRAVPSSSTLYSAAFSPDGTKLYASQWNGQYWQIDLALPDDAGVSAPLGASQGALRLAIDGKIYGTSFNSTNLAVIQNPNAPAATLTVTSAAMPAGCIPSYGLPGMGDL